MATMSRNQIVVSQGTSTLNCHEFYCIADAVDLNLTVRHLDKVFVKVYETKNRWRFMGLKLGVSKRS